jgi:hypothetical protein
LNGTNSKAKAEETIFKLWLPQALAIGVSYESFGKLNTKKLEPFRDAFKITQDEARANLWLQGLYFKMAIVAAFDKETSYPDKPLDLVANKPTNNSVPNNLTPSVSEIENKSIRFSAWADVFNENFIKEHPDATKPDVIKDIPNNQEGH